MKRFHLSTRVICLVLTALFILSSFTACKRQPQATNTAVTPTATAPASTVVNKGINTDYVAPPVTVLKSSDEYSKMTDIELSRYAGAEGMVLLENSKIPFPILRMTPLLFWEAPKSIS